MPTEAPGIESLQGAVRRTLKDHWVFFLVEGILLLIFGFLAIILPTVATVAIELVIGWLLLLSGLIGLVTSWRMHGGAGSGWSWASAILGIIAGVLLLRWPLSGVISLTLVLIWFFLLEGVVSIMFALAHRREAAAHWAWMLVSGLIDVALAAILLIGLPGTAAWALGLLVGINMVFGGIALISMALGARPAVPSGGPAAAGGV